MMKEFDWKPIQEWLKNTMDNGGDFVLREAPLVAQELIAWEFWSNAIIAGALLPAAVIIVGMLWWFRKEIYSGLAGRCEGKAAMSIAALALGSAAIVVALLNGATCARKATKAAVAPRVVLIEKISELTKQSIVTQ